MTRGPVGCRERAPLGGVTPLLLLLLLSGLFYGCLAGPPRPRPGTFTSTDAAPTYHVLRGYRRRWREQVEDGVELARAFWGSYGPVHVWIAGREGDRPTPPAAAAEFVSEYCEWRAGGEARGAEELHDHASARFLDVVARGDAEAYLSWVDEIDPPTAELVFLNVHQWHFDADPIPDPVLRGVHEYTHVFQMAFAEMPTWMMEGGAVFAEAWIPWAAGRCDAAFVSARMRTSMARAQRARSDGRSIADMEAIDDAPPEIRGYYRELAYDAGAWATVLLIHRSPTRSVAALRDAFYPMVSALGWERALCRYTGAASKEAFYASFDQFLARPEAERERVLRELRR